MLPHIPQRAEELGRYRLLEQLGQGAFGAVFRAEDTEDGREVALKILTHARPSSLSRFKQEFRALRDLRHPNLVQMHELFEHEGQWVISMQLVRGQGFWEWVRPGPFDVGNSNASLVHEKRLRSVLADLAQGLSALHSASLVHRDLKPANIRITAEGRAVLLDFGLVTGLDSEAQSTHAGAPGTAAYMAPEQAASLKVTDAADWYALGVCLYEVLTGHLPFRAETAIGLMLAKQGKLPPPPSSALTRTATIPADLESLCMQLLEPEPSRRAGAQAVADVLSRDEPRFVPLDSSELLPEVPSLMPLPTLGVPLQGRETELHLLEEAFARSQNGELRMVLIEGESGIGKSTLVQTFVRLLRVQHTDALALSGRCYENEQVPYKALDGCIDDLTRVLKRIPKEHCALMMPARAALLAQLFPVMADVPAIAQAPLKGASAEPNARRIEAFRALCDLLHKLAVERPLLLVIDDLQWSDPESFRLLKAIIDDKPPLLLVLMVRPADELPEQVREQVRVLHGRPGTDVVSLKGLPAAGAEALAARLLGERAPAGWLQAITRESLGHPLFIDALAQYAASHEVGRSGSISLEAALTARIESVNASARHLLDLLALAAKPHDRRLLESAFGRPLDEALALLLARKLARTRGAKQLVCFHDRVRALVVQSMDRLTRDTLHRALATALSDRPGTDPAEAALHWEQAGEPQRASIGFEKAADVALASLAFTRAAELYQQALALCDEAEATQRLKVQRAHALARGGRSAEAAALYQQAATTAEGEQEVRLRIWAAQHLLQSGQVANGVEAARTLLSDLGMGLPRSENAALARIVWDRTRMSLRGLAIKPAREGGVDPRTTLQLEAAWQLFHPLAVTEILPSANLSAAHLRRALDAGDPAHAVRALAQEAGMRAIQSPLAEASYLPLLQTSRELAAQVSDPALDAFVAYIEGIVSTFRGQYHGTFGPIRSAEAILRERCPEEPWLLTNVRQLLSQSLHFVGEHRALATRTDAWLTEAREREDVFAQTVLFGLGWGFVRQLMEDDPAAALAELERTMVTWPREPFSYASLGELAALWLVEGYRGGAGLQHWLERERPRLRRAALLKVAPLTRVLDAGALSAGAALGALVHARAAERDQLTREVRRGLAVLKRERLDLARGFALLVEAQLLALQAKAEPALDLAKRAAQAFAALGMYQQHGAAYLQGLLEGGDEGRRRREAALAFFRDQGWKRPERAMRMCVPVLPALEAPESRPAAARRNVLADRFELLHPLGQGGYGNVTLARDIQTGRRVAIKELTRTSPSALLRFKQEFRALQALRHPRLVRLDGLFENQGSWFIAMQWVDGTDLRAWTRPEGKLDVGRTREAFASLAEGLTALHDAGFCHRDIKPENVRVTREGKVVLLDFGLIADLSDETSDDAEVGTAAYMAPEQKPGAVVGQEADVYAMGVCLYEALCGKLPFEGDLPVHIMQNKRRGVPALPPSRIAPAESIPKDLEDLALEMLDHTPSGRPPVIELPTLLRGGLALATSSRPPAAAHSLRPASATHFAGRNAELSHLDAALLDGGRQRTPRIVLVEGESGIGKSALVAQWLTSVRRQTPNVKLLRGRCYENERVPYSAFDGVVDELARLLRRLPQDACAALLPPCAAVLAELFKSLGSVPAIGEAPRKGVLADPLARRQQGFVALRTLLRNLCSEGPLVLVVDDLQWADVESFRLLHALLREEGAPPLLLVATIRPAQELSAELQQPIAELSSWSFTTRLALAPLADDQARALAARMLDTQDDDLVRRVVTQAQGHPLFLTELAGHARRAGHGQALTLEAAVAARLRALRPGPRRLLELVALAGRPHGLQVYERALDPDGLADAKLDEALAVLSAEKLVRIQKDQQIVCFHDRIRAVAVADVPQGAWQKLHLCLARGLEGESGTDPAERARLWEEAREPARAAAAYEEAGHAALEALAFEQAARMFGRALELTQDDATMRQRLTIQRGHALARGGRSAEAASLYRQAAETAEGELKVRLGIWAAQHLLQSAQVEAGIAAARNLLSALGIGLPRGEKAALARIVWDRARMSLRGLAIKPAPKGGVDPQTVLQLEAAWQLFHPLAVTEILPSANLSAAHLRRALDAGDPVHAARALAQEVGIRAIQAPLAEASYRPLLETSRGLAKKIGDPALDAFLAYIEGMAAEHRGAFPTALACFRRGELVLRERCPDEPWLLTNMRYMLSSDLYKLGEHRELAAQTKPWFAEARERGDIFAQTIFYGLGYGFLGLLMDDDPLAALAELERTTAAWPREPFSTSGLGELAARWCIEPYAGGAGLHRWLERERPRLRRAVIIKTAPFLRSLVKAIEAYASIAAAAAARQEDRAPLIREANRSLALLYRERLDLAHALGRLIEAQLLAVQGNADSALKRAAEAAQALAALSMYQQHGAAYLQGLLEGGDAGRARRDAALAFFRDQGWKRPERAMAMVVPALPLIENG